MNDKQHSLETEQDTNRQRPTMSDAELPAAEAAREPAADELDARRAEADEWRDKYLRKLAEFDNFRRRTRQESEMLREYVAESLIVELLPVLDDFDRTLSNMAGADDPFCKGVELIRGKLLSFFEAHNVSRIECRGKPFDPAEQDALLMRPAPDFPPGTVLDEITPGYRMGDRVIRHAQVVVSAEAEPPAGESSPDSPSAQ